MLFRSQEKSGLGGDYEYITNPQEFYAKIRVIKNKLWNHSANFFDEAGNIDKNKLDDLLKNPGNYFKRGEIDFRLLKVLDKDKIDKVGDLFNQLVKVDKKAPTSQIA